VDVLPGAPPTTTTTKPERSDAKKKAKTPSDD
jgi:hypothetical protein